MPLADGFNRTYLGADWVPCLGGIWTISGGAAARPTVQFIGNVMRRRETYPDDQYSQAVVRITSGATASRGGVTARTSATGDCYFAYFDAVNNLTLKERVGGADTFLDSATVTAAADTPYTLKINVSGTTITVLQDGVQKLSTTSGSLSSGAPGIYQLTDATAGFGDIEDFECTTPTASTPLVPYFLWAAAVSSGVGSITPAIPSGVEPNDILLLFVETANQVPTLTTANGFVEASSSPQGTGTAAGTASTLLAVYWKRAVGSDSSPVVADSGNHTVGRIAAFRACIETGNPWNVSAGDVAGSASTSVTIPGATTTVPDCLAVAAVANATDTATSQTSGWTNANLANLLERLDSNSASGNGGGFGMATGEKLAAGSIGSTTATLATSSVQGRVMLALMPSPYPAGYRPEWMLARLTISGL